MYKQRDDNVDVPAIVPIEDVLAFGRCGVESVHGGASVHYQATPRFALLADFHDFDEHERLVGVAVVNERLVVLLGSDAELRCGEMMALEWTHIDFSKRQLH